MIELGEYQTLPVRKRVSFGVYLGTEDDTVLLPERYVPGGTEVGDHLRVFVYNDSEDRPVATTLTPAATLRRVAAMEVVDTTEHGAFVDWDLAKDLFVPHREQLRKMAVGERHVVQVRRDPQTDRLMGSSRLHEFFDHDVRHLQVGRQVALLVYDLTDFGARVIVDERYAGLIHDADLPERPEIGDELIGYIALIRRDHKVDVTLDQRGRGATLDAQELILEALARTGFLPLHDKSPPGEIAARLDMSKKSFKAAIGGLYRRRLIALEDDGIRLLR